MTRVPGVHRQLPGLVRALLLCLGTGTAQATRLPAQIPAAIEQERRDFAAWLAAAPLSPYGAVALQPLGPGLSLGPDSADIPLPGTVPGRVVEAGGAVWLDQGSGRRAIPRGRPLQLGAYRLLASGPRGRTLFAVYGPVRPGPAPEYFPYAPTLSFTAPLEPPERRGSFRTLGLDGAETEAQEAGFLSLVIGGRSARLRVYRMGATDDEEAELQVFFRDETNGKGSYPAGRFVTLESTGAGRYRLDFNRARNPFCAYTTVYPCPAPWPGNRLPTAIEAGERYHSAQ